MVPSTKVQVSKLAPELLRPALLPLPDESRDARRDQLRVVAKVLVGGGPGERVAEGAHGVARVGVALPAVGGVGLDDHARRGPGAAVPQHLGLVLARLGVEEALAGEADDAGAQAVAVAEGVARAHGKGHLGADADERHVRLVVLDEGVGAAEDAVARRVGRVLLEVLAGERDDGGGVAGREGGDEGSRDLLAVAGADVQKVGHGAVQGGELDGLVGGAVLARADAVVRADVDRLQALQGAHADAWRRVDVEDEEGGGHGEDCALAVGGEAVGDGRHGVLTDAPVDVAA